jgi:hypothetical protein
MSFADLCVPKTLNCPRSREEQGSASTLSLDDSLVVAGVG